MKEKYKKDGQKIFCGDNLEVMSTLASESFELIYCDVLYNSGKKFANYTDDLGGPKEAVEWYRPRFMEMKRLLKPNGSIWIHCNWRLDSYLRCLLDEIFGVWNFKSRITRKHSNIRGFAYELDPVSDCILYYVKDKDNYIFNEEHDGIYRYFPLVEQGIFGKKSCVLPLPDGNTLDLKDIGMHLLPKYEHYIKMLEAGEIVIKQGKVFRFTDVKPISNIWDEFEMQDTYNRTIASTVENNAYDTPKPDAVLSRIIKIASNKGDMVGDFFLGGGTTAVITKRYERKGIFCDINPHSIEVTIAKLEEEPSR